MNASRSNAMNHTPHSSTEAFLDNAIDQAFIAASRREWPGAPRNLVIEEFLMTPQQRTHTRRSLSSRARTRLLVWLGIGTVAVGGVAYGAKQSSEPVTTFYHVVVGTLHLTRASDQPVADAGSVVAGIIDVEGHLIATGDGEVLCRVEGQPLQLDTVRLDGELDVRVEWQETAQEVRVEGVEIDVQVNFAVPLRPPGK